MTVDVCIRLPSPRLMAELAWSMPRIVFTAEHAREVRDR